MPHKILIVDDSMYMRVTLQSIILQAGYEVVGAVEDGTQGLKLFKEQNPDMVALDISLPDTDDSIRVLRQMREYNQEAVVLIATPLGNRDGVTEAIQAGAKDFICKPYNPYHVIETLKKYIPA